MATSPVLEKRKPTARAKPAETVSETKPVFSCEYCKKSFAREKTLISHICAKKARFLDQDRKHVKVGFLAYRKFIEICYRRKTEPLYSEFANSPQYDVFVKVGKYLLDINAIDPLQFVEFVLRMGTPIDKWVSPVIYETYVRELTKKESPDRAVERNIQLMQQWAIETGEEWQDFFRKIAPSLATLWIKSGRISPWVLYNADSGKELLGRLSDEQLTLVEKYIDPKFWGLKLTRHLDEIDAIRMTLREFGV